ncbi:MAG: hypothetical protein LBT44_09590 [Clostridiales bacterium]|nr:hypothetical protein [Clostridiales bacterium]
MNGEQKKLGALYATLSVDRKTVVLGRYISASSWLAQLRLRLWQKALSLNFSPE